MFGFEHPPTAHKTFLHRKPNCPDAVPQNTLAAGGRSAANHRYHHLEPFLRSYGVARTAGYYETFARLYDEVRSLDRQQHLAVNHLQQRVKRGCMFRKPLPCIKTEKRNASRIVVYQFPAHHAAVGILHLCAGTKHFAFFKLCHIGLLFCLSVYKQRGISGFITKKGRSPTETPLAVYSKMFAARLLVERANAHAVPVRLLEHIAYALAFCLNAACLDSVLLNEHVLHSLCAVL